jgi:heavy metal sensor kinase
MNRRSIRLRLTLWYAGVLALTLAVVGVGVWLGIRESLTETVDKDLRSRVRTIRAFLDRPPSAGENSTAIDELLENAELAPAGTRIRIADTAGRWLYQSSDAQSWNAPPSVNPLPARGIAETIVQKGRPVRVLTAPISPGIIQIGIPIDELDELLTGFTWSAVLAIPLLLFLASAGGYWMSRRALAPVEYIARTAGDIQAQNLSERLPVAGTGDELDHLSVTLNAMLARLESSFRRITQFTADASHELRTPVAIIRTTAEVTRKKPRTEKEYTEALDRILAESERTTELIEDLMMLARADVNAQKMFLEPVELAALAQAACVEAKPLAEAAAVQLRTGSMPACTVCGDDRALQRLLLILLDNAIKYSRPGGEVHLSLGISRRNHQQVAVFEVRDNGIGVSAEDLPHIFERFYRASKDRSRKVAGVGLGLSIAEWIARQHHGSIEVESQLGVGSVFRVLLPAL